MVKTVSILDVIDALTKNVTALNTYANNVENQTKIDLHSTQTFHGLVEAVIEDIESANDTVILALTKLKSVK